MVFFKGEIPSCIVDYEIADSSPGAADLIRLTIHDHDTPFWRTRSFDFPFESRNLLIQDHVQTFLDETNLQYGALEILIDDENGDKYPVAHYRPYESEVERLGLLDDEG